MTHRLLLPITTVTLALLLAATTVAAQDDDSDHIPPLRCESQFNKTEQCPIEGRMRLARQLSVTRCVEDQNWGQSRRMLWVTAGCRAEFVADGQGRGRWPERGRGRDRDDDGERLVCESYEQKDRECRIRAPRGAPGQAEVGDTVRRGSQLGLGPPRRVGQRRLPCRVPCVLTADHTLAVADTQIRPK